MSDNKMSCNAGLLPIAMVSSGVFAILKMMGLIAWPWWLVFTPLILWAVLTLCAFVIAFAALYLIAKWSGK